MLECFRKCKVDRISLVSSFDDQLLFMTFAENVIENSLFTNAYRNYNSLAIKTKCFKKIVLFITCSKK